MHSASSFYIITYIKSSNTADALHGDSLMNTWTYKIYTFRLYVYTNSDIYYSACKLLEKYRWKAKEMRKRARNHFPFMQIRSRLLASQRGCINIYNAAKDFDWTFSSLDVNISFFSFGAKGCSAVVAKVKWSVKLYYITRKRRRRRRYRFIPISIFGVGYVQKIY